VDELSRLFQDAPEMFDAGGGRRKLVIFTEHRDTLNYLVERIRTFLDARRQSSRSMASAARPSAVRPRPGSRTTPMHCSRGD